MKRKERAEGRTCQCRRRFRSSKTRTGKRRRETHLEQHVGSLVRAKNDRVCKRARDIICAADWTVVEHVPL